MATIRPRQLPIIICLSLLLTSSLLWASQANRPFAQYSKQDSFSNVSASNPTFYRDILPILQGHCQPCHHRGGIAPMPFETYEDTRRYAKLIGTVTADKSMPPSFAVPEVGRVVNDPSLTLEQITSFKAWANAQAPAGNLKDAPSPGAQSSRWTIGEPSFILKLVAPPQTKALPPSQYVYEIVPTGLAADRWIQAAEIRLSVPTNLTHAVLFIRPSKSNWFRKAPVRKLFTSASRHGSPGSHLDLLLVYGPGSASAEWPTGMAKFIPKGADLVLQMEYTADPSNGPDQIDVGFLFSKQPPLQRILTLEIANHDFVIPANATEFRVEASRILPMPVVLLSCFPVMHQHGTRFEYDIIKQGETADAGLQLRIETLLRVRYDLRWQVNYQFIEPQLLNAGTKLQAVAWYDNSKNNPRNPNANTSVRSGESPADEVMAAFFEVAVPANADMRAYAPARRHH
jgi:hypothetical protein